jgi:hypothetical protein
MGKDGHVPEFSLTSEGDNARRPAEWRVVLTVITAWFFVHMMYRTVIMYM